MASYSVLNKFCASSFLYPEMFGTSFDVDINKRRENYERGLKTGEECTKVWVSANGTWGGDTKNGGIITSYEGIGYHAYTADFWRGILNSGVPVYIFRFDENYRIRKYKLNREGGLFGPTAELLEV